MQVRGWALVGMLVACGGGEAPPVAPSPGGTVPPLPPVAIDIGVPVARVGELGVVGASEFADAAARQAREQGTPLTPEQRQALARELAQEEALWQEAARLGLYRDPKIRKTMVTLLTRQQVFSKVRSNDFSDEALRAYFDAHRDEFVIPEKVQIKKVFIAIDARRTEAQAIARANEVRAKIVAEPGKFKELAAEYSEDTWKRRGGDLGYVPKTGQAGVEPAVIEAAFALPVLGVSPVFIAGGGANVVLNAAHREEMVRGFDQMKGTVLRKMKNERSKELLDAYVAEIEVKYPVVIDDAALAGVDLTAVGRVQLDPVDEPDLDDGADEPHGENE
jgi:parvulin-like peptidyl-prolyl isomerase